MPDTRRQTIIIAVLIVLIAVAGVFAKQFNKEVQNANANANLTENTQAATTMQSMRVTYENEKNSLKQQYDRISTDKSATAQEKKDAQDKLMKLLDKGQTENTVENTLIEKGYEDVLCIYGDKSIELYVKSKEALTKEDTSQIMNTVVSITKISPKNVYIRPGK